MEAPRTPGPGFVYRPVPGSAPQWFIFDTGNNDRSVIDSECADRLKLARSAEEKVQIGAGSGASPGYKAIRIMWVNPGTPAAEARLQIGDEILSIDGRKIMSLDEARGLFRTPGTRRLEIRREGRSMQVRLEARRMV